MPSGLSPRSLFQNANPLEEPAAEFNLNFFQRLNVQPVVNARDAEKQVVAEEEVADLEYYRNIDTLLNIIKTANIGLQDTIDILIHQFTAGSSSAISLTASGRYSHFCFEFLR